MEIKAADVAKLRKMTGAGMMDCKNALVEAKGDFDRAQEILREKGKQISAKRSDRTASEGVVVAELVGQTKAYMTCLACETDFVAKNEEFSNAAKAILDIAVANDVENLEQLLEVKMGDSTVAETVTERSGQTGEKIELAYYDKIEAPMCVLYVHSNNKIGVLVGFNKKIAENAAYDVAMQVAAMAPIALTEDDCPKDVIERELSIGREQARLEGKPEQMLDRIAEGKLRKFLSETVLLNQAFIKDPKMSVSEYIKSIDKDATVTVFKRFALGD